VIKKLSSFIFKDIGWKILALISAVLLWNVAWGIEDPYIKKTISKTLQLVNENMLDDNNYIIMNRDKILSNVKVSIQGRSHNLQNFGNQSNYVSAYVDLRSLDSSYGNRLGEPISLKINVALSGNLANVLGVEPESATIILDKMVTRSLPVSIDMTGEPDDGFESVKPAYQDPVALRAPQTVLEKVEKVVASISVKGADLDVLEDAPLTVLGKDGKDMTDQVELSFETVSLAAKIYPKKTVPLKAVFEGEPADEYWVSGTAVDPPTIEIAGPQEELDLIEEIELKPVLMNGESESFEVSRNVNDALEGSAIVSSSNSPAVTVDVTIEEEDTKDITLENTNIAIINDASEMDVQILNLEVTVTIRGPSIVLEKLDETNMRAEVDLSGMSKGIYDVPLYIEFPAGITLVRQVFVRVVIGDDLSAAAIFSSSYDDDDSNEASG
jgi:YbbR domain-containing protein